MATISLSSLVTFGQRAAKYCRETLAFDSPSSRTATSRLASALGVLTTVVEADYGRIASSTFRALSDVRPSVGPLLILAFNILLVTGGGVLCLSGYGFATGLSIVVLALAPALMLLNIALFAWMEEKRRPGLLRAISLDEKYPSIVPEKSETAPDEKAELARSTATQDI
jgi:hypothetical protein